MDLQEIQLLAIVLFSLIAFSIIILSYFFYKIKRSVSARHSLYKSPVPGYVYDGNHGFIIRTPRLEVVRRTYIDNLPSQPESMRSESPAGIYFEKVLDEIIIQNKPGTTEELKVLSRIILN